MLGRVDQQLRVNYQMLDSHDLRQVAVTSRKLANYMFNYLAIMVTISTIFLNMTDTPEAYAKRTQLWEYVRTLDPRLYTRMRYFALPGLANLPTAPGRKLSLAIYRASRKIFKFN